jgi:hypothetical protein
MKTLKLISPSLKRKVLPMENKRDNSGALFVNDRKEKPTQPDYNGSAVIAGKEMWVCGWKKTGKSGKPFMSLAFKIKEAKGEESQAAKNDDGFF